MKIHLERLDGEQMTSEIVKSGYFVAMPLNCVKFMM